MSRPGGERARADGFALIGLGAGARAFGIALGTVAGLATVVTTVRVLGATDYGALAFALSVAVVVAGVGRLGLEPAVARAVAVVRDAEDRVSRTADVGRGALGLVAATGLVGAVVAFALIHAGTAGVEQESRLALGLGIGLSVYAANAAAVSAALARGVGNVVLMEVPNLVSTLGRLLAVAVVILLDLADLTWIAVGYGIAALVGSWVSWSVARRLTGSFRVLRPSGHATRAMLAAAIPFAVTGVGMILISRLDVVVLGLVRSSAEVGSYEPALRIVEQAMLVVPLLFGAQFLPVATRAFGAGEHQAFGELLVGVSKIIVVVSLSAVVVLAAFPETVLRTLYGSGFPASGTVVWLLLPGFAANLGLGLCSSALAATGARRALVRSGVVATVAMGVLAAALIPAFGVEGAAAATSGTYLVLTAWVVRELHHVAGVHPFRPDLVVTLLTAAAPIGAAFAVRTRADDLGLLIALALSIGLTAAWVAALLATRVLRRHELTRLVPRSA